MFHCMPLTYFIHSLYSVLNVGKDEAIVRVGLLLTRLIILLIVHHSRTPAILEQACALYILVLF